MTSINLDFPTSVVPKLSSIYRVSELILYNLKWLEMTLKYNILTCIYDLYMAKGWAFLISLFTFNKNFFQKIGKHAHVSKEHDKTKIS